jgi:SPP1 gp7 family putative phage head morphogenesis protein
MADYAHELTDRELTALENKIAAAYERAGESVKKRAEEYLKEIKPEADRLLKAMTDATDDKTYKAARRAYQQFLRDQTIASKRFSDLQSKLVADLTKFNQQSAAEIAQRMNGVFSLNHNFAAYTLEHDLGLNLQFTLYDERTVERLLRDQPKLLPKPKIDVALDKRWNQQKISGEIAQAILTGDPIERIADRLQTVTDMNRNSAIRNARTAITGAENAGRVESYHYAESIGITLQKEWLATLDDRTRDEHRDLDGQRVDVDEPFRVGGDEIMFPGDPDAEGYLVYGCRCTLVSSVEGVKDLDPVYRRDNISGEKIDNMSYREWEAAKRGEG